MKNIVYIGLALSLVCTLSRNAIADDGGPDGGDTDTDTGADIEYCETASDPCCLDNGSDSEVLALSGCHGEPYGPAEVGQVAGECTYDPESPGGLGNCSGISQCWNFKKWHDPATSAVGGECGLCLMLCTDFSECPDGNTAMYTYDFCTSSCPEGMRCWVYQFNDVKRGLCMVDCLSDADCSSGYCATQWNVCVPRPEYCPLPEDTDNDTETSTESSDSGGYPDGGGGGPDEGGCVCSPTRARADVSLFDFLLSRLFPFAIS